MAADYLKLMHEREDIRRALDGKDLLYGGDLARQVLAQRRKLDELIGSTPGGDQLLDPGKEKKAEEAKP